MLGTVPSTVLTERLDHLVEQGVLERRPYDHRPRSATSGWRGRRGHACGEITDVELRCDHCGEPMRAGDVDLLPDPGVAGSAT
ncbi:hypothetical protein [Lentzea cavernae]|uniref:Uncharacterized protein n=1 Tax=Lentzea cavernae TaxID=2020703 RepID=A0ABQ3MW80_9PSEU|nr:hypothetical protein [Lentzea cavernae]GHH60096.1 hypothetical protein GCM10017774_84060 [Lentzea cavernae]